MPARPAPRMDKMLDVEKKPKRANVKIKVPKWAREEKEVNAEFSELVKEVISLAEVKAEKIDEKEIIEHIRIARAKVPANWRKFLSEVLTKATEGRKAVGPEGFMTINELFKVALSSARPRTVKKKPLEKVRITVKEMVAKRMSGMPAFEEEAVVCALELAVLLDLYSQKRNISRLSFKKDWMEKKREKGKKKVV